eukprot:406760_1
MVHVTLNFFAPMIISVMLLDFVSLLVNTYLFVKPIYLINQMMKETVKDKSHIVVDSKKENCTELKLKQIAIKQFLLSLIAMISTIIAYPGMILFELAQVWGIIDTVLSTFCVILMYRFYDKLAWKLFKQLCCCCCRKWIQFHDDITELNKHIDDANVKSSTAVVTIKTEITQTVASNGVTVVVS